MSKSSAWVVCACGRRDVSERRTNDRGPFNYVGTKTVMRCPDCADATGHASKCRDCCPTGHGTRWEPMDAREQAFERDEARRKTADFPRDDG